MPTRLRLLRVRRVDWIDAAVLLGRWRRLPVIHKKRNRKWIVGFMIFSLLYFGFCERMYRRSDDRECCGALFDRTMRCLWVLAFFLLLL